MQQGMDPLLKDWIQVISWGVAIIGGLVAAFVALYQLSASNKQRRRELRWQQANAGRQLLDEMFDDSKSKDALRMLDFPGRDEFKDIPASDKKVGFSDIRKALEVTTTNDGDYLTFTYKDDKSVFIRDRFDGLFYYLERFEYFRENELLEFRDIRTPIEYYAKIIAKHNGLFLHYSKTVGYDGAAKLLEELQKTSLS